MVLSSSTYILEEFMHMLTSNGHGHDGCTVTSIFEMATFEAPLGGFTVGTTESKMDMALGANIA